MSYVTELLKQELRFKKQFSCDKVRYKNSQGEYTYNQETKTLYYQDNNSKYPKFMGNLTL
jgi:hypothetical protein